MSKVNNQIYRVKGEFYLTDILKDLMEHGLINIFRQQEGTSSRKIIFCYDTNDLSFYNAGGYLMVIAEQEDRSPITYEVVFKKNKDSTEQSFALKDSSAKNAKVDFSNLNIEDILARASKFDISSIKKTLEIKQKLNNNLTLTINDFTHYLQYVSTRMMNSGIGTEIDFKVSPSVVISLGGDRCYDNIMFFELKDSTKQTSDPALNSALSEESAQAFETFKNVMKKKEYKATKVNGNLYGYILSLYPEYLAKNNSQPGNS